MPFYEYECSACGHRFEVLQRMSDDPLTTCESCGEETVSRVLFAPAIHFKGSGFHNTDYGTRRRPAGGDNGNGGSGETAGAGASSGSGDASGSGKTVGLNEV